MSRLEWTRAIPGEPAFTWQDAAVLLDLTYGEATWFPWLGEVGEALPTTYLVPVSFTRPEYAAEPESSALSVAIMETLTREGWEAFDWLSRAVYSSEQSPFVRVRKAREFDGIPKPKWGDFARWERAITLAAMERVDAGEAFVWHDQAYVEARDTLLAQPLHHDVLGDDVHTGAGLAHMPGMAYMANRVAGAGLHYPRAVMRREGDAAAHDPGDLVDVWTEGEAHSLIEAVALRTNHLESARNIMRKRNIELRRIAVSDHGGLPPGASESEIEDARIDAMERLYAALKPEALDAAMLAEVAKLAAEDALPTDLGRARQVLIARLEAAATGHQKALKGALTQQAIDSWAQCVDLDEALVEIAKQCRIGVLKLTNATHTTWKKVSGAWEKAAPQEGPVDHEGEGDPEATLGASGELYRDTASGIPNAKAIFDAGVAAIVAVRVLNTPAVSYNISGRLVTVRAEQPSVDPPIEGPLAAAHYGFAGLAGTDVRSGVDIKFYAPSKDTDPLIQTYDFDDSFAGKVRITLTVANLCGPTDFSIDLQVTANGSIRRV